MSYRNKFQDSISVSEESQFSEDCCICTTFYKGSILWLRGVLYARENNYHGRYIKIVNSILFKRSEKFSINFKDAMIMANDNHLYNLQYKKFNQIIQEIKQSITLNIHAHQHYHKIYFGQKNYDIMLKYHNKKKTLLEARKNNKSQYKPKFVIDKSALDKKSDFKILQNSTLNKNYDFHPVELFERQQKSKYETSLCEIQKLKKNLSIMIGELKMSDQVYPQIKNLIKPYIDFIKSKEELKFRKKLENNISEIHQDKNRLKKSQNFRLYTSPDTQDDFDAENRYAEAYGFLVQQNPELKKKKKRLLLRKEVSRDKSTTNLSRTKLTAYTKYTRQTTQQGSQLMISATNSSTTFNLRRSKSKSKPSGTSKNKIILLNSTSKNKLRPSGSNTMIKEKSLNKSKKLLMQYKA